MELYNDRIRVAIYLRKSRADEPIEALAKHKSVLSRIAIEKGWEFDIYEEIGSSISLDWRTEFDKMLSHIDLYKYVLVMDTDRIGRSFIVFEEIKKPFKYHGVIIKTPAQEIDLRIEGHELLLDFQTVIAQGEYKQTVKRLKLGKIEGARKGHWVNGVAPFGYNYDAKLKKLTLNEQEHPLAVEIFSMALKNMSFSEISIKLNLMGFRTRMGNDFSPASIKTILTNRAYVGEVIFRQKSQIKGGQDEIVITPKSHPAIVSELDWLEIQKMVKSRRTNHGKVASVVKSMVQGILYCGCCGYKLPINLPKGSQKASVKNCRTVDAYGNHCPNKSVPLKPVEDAVIAVVMSFRDEALAKARELHLTDNGHLKIEFEASMRLKQAELTKQEAVLDVLLDSMIDGTITKEQYNQKKDQRETVMKSLKDEIRRIELQLESMDATKQMAKLKEVIRVIDNLQTVDLTVANRFLMSLVDKVVVTAKPAESAGYRRAKTEPTVEVFLAE